MLKYLITARNPIACFSRWPETLAVVLSFSLSINSAVASESASFFNSLTRDIGGPNTCPPLSLRRVDFDSEKERLVVLFNAATDDCQKAQFAWQIQSKATDLSEQKRWTLETIQSLFRKHDYRGAMVAALGSLFNNSVFNTDPEIRIWPLRIAAAANAELGIHKDRIWLDWLLGRSMDSRAAMIGVGLFLFDFPDSRWTSEALDIEIATIDSLFVRALATSEFHKTHKRGYFFDWFRKSSAPLFSRYVLLNSYPDWLCAYYSDRALGLMAQGVCAIGPEDIEDFKAFLRYINEKSKTYHDFLRELV